MDPHAGNAMGMQPMSMPMGMQQAMSMPMATANSGPNPVGMNPMAGGGQYGVPPQQQQMMMMNAGGGMNPQQMGMNPQQQMNAMKMNPGAMNPNMQMGGGGQPMGADWRIQLTREHRANLIAKIYNEMVRVASDPPPGIKLWMNVSWYELTLYKESRTQEDYITKIFNRLKSLRAQPTDVNAAMSAQTLQNNGMLSRLDFSYYSNPNVGVRPVPPPTVQTQSAGGYPGHPQQFNGASGHPQAPAAPSQAQVKQQQQMASGMPNPAAANPPGQTPDPAAAARTGMPNGAVKPDAALGNVADSAAEYWRQHDALKAKYHDDVDKVHSAFKKYVDHMKDHNETDQKKKLRYLLSYVQLCASVLSEDKTTHQPRKLEELDKVYKYIVKIVNPYLKKLRTETDKRSFTPGGSSSGGGPAGAGGPGPAPTGSPPSGPAGNPGPQGGNTGIPMNMMDPNAAMRQQQQQQQQQLQQQQQQAQQQAQQHNAQQNASNQPNQQQQQQQQQQGPGGAQQQNAQQKQQQYQQHLQRQHQMQQQQQQQQRLQMQRQQQLQMQRQQQQQQMVQQQQQLQNQQKPQGPGQQQPAQGGPQQAAQMQKQQPNQPNQQQQNQANSQAQQQQQQRAQQGQQGPQGPNQPTGQQQQPSQAQQQAQQQQLRQQQAQQQQAQQQQTQQQAQQQKPQAPPQQMQQSRDLARQQESPSMSSGLSMLDDYGGMELQMPSNLSGPGSTSSYSLGFPNDLSPTGFGDLGMLDIDGSGLSSLSYDGQDTPNSGNGGRHGAGNDSNGDDSGDNADLMTFVEAL